MDETHYSLNLAAVVGWGGGGGGDGGDWLYFYLSHTNIMCLFAPMQEFLTQFCGAPLYWKLSASILITSLGSQAPSVDYKPKITTA